MSEQTLAGIGILAGLAAADREMLEKRCRWRRFSAGEQIIDRTAESHDVYFVVNGAVRVVNYAASGREVANTRSARRQSRSSSTASPGPS